MSTPNQYTNNKILNLRQLITPGQVSNPALTLFGVQSVSKNLPESGNPKGVTSTSFVRGCAATPLED